MEITYRRLAYQDSDQYREIRLESLKLHPESFGSNYEEQKAMPKLMFQKAIEQPYDDRFIIGAFNHCNLIGITGFIPFVFEKEDEYKNTGTIIQVYVKASFRSKGIGFNLMNKAVKEAFQLPYIQKIILGVRKDNISAIRVYQKIGFQSIKHVNVEKEEEHPEILTMILSRAE